MIKKFHIFLNIILPIFHIISIIITMTCNVGCHIYKYYTPKYLNIEPGIYLTPQDIQKLCLGMTKSAILSNIKLPPTLKNIFGLNKWYYVYYDYNITGQITYQSIELEFNSEDILISINIL